MSKSLLRPCLTHERFKHRWRTWEQWLLIVMTAPVSHSNKSGWPAASNTVQSPKIFWHFVFWESIDLVYYAKWNATMLLCHATSRGWPEHTCWYGILDVGCRQRPVERWQLCQRSPGSMVVQPMWQQQPQRGLPPGNNPRLLYFMLNHILCSGSQSMQLYSCDPVYAWYVKALGHLFIGSSSEWSKGHVSWILTSVQPSRSKHWLEACCTSIRRQIMLNCTLVYVTK